MFGEDQLQASIQLSENLRDGGLNTELYFERNPLGHQIRYALKKGIPFVIIVGPDEAAAGQVTIRNLPLNEQRTVTRETMIAQVKDWEANAGA